MSLAGLPDAAFSAPEAPAVTAVRGVERLFEAVAVAGVALYGVGFATGWVDLSVGVSVGVVGAAGNLLLGFGRSVVLEPADESGPRTDASSR
jgi:hypothetical protein